ncbi:TIGR01212 family radical SAM protein [Peptoniphilus equinus]|uniref:TIGR01212 family radical SAM protein n=1 Tax=Peptoniphilus equinus TaxID=3016343 RepID=A0ABY7QWH8_9FIRM|nr:TIGR01212 family radical SAM protein [Peptoniphilus equinus]WBW50731.1 TIGR01212 family radical SAM protein [Peptoniphilus equinus]
MKNNPPLYNTYSQFLYNYFGEKVYKLPIKLNLTCPNRDGTLAIGGCTFCGEEGGSFENTDGTIANQLELNKARVIKRFKAKKFIAYFQNFTNTYVDFESFKANVEAALISDIVGVSISTRPDCLSEEVLDYLAEVNKTYFVTLEIGLQTANYHTLHKVNRGHGTADFVDAVLRAHRRGLRVCAHVILNLPYDDTLDTVETSKLISVLGVEEVKLHALYIVKNTVMGELYQSGKIDIISLDDYEKRVILFLQHLSADVVVQRLIGRAPEENALFCNWNTSWWKIRDAIVAKMEQSNAYQGQYYERT